MVSLQRLTGMRPGEMVVMRSVEIDRSADVWTYTATSHKTEHHGESTTTYFGQQG